MNENEKEKIAKYINQHEQQGIQDGTLEHPVIDSGLSREKAIEAILENKPECPPEILEKLALTTVRYIGFDEKFHEGQIIVHADLQKDIEDLFEFMIAEKFPIAGAVPISEYKDVDEDSMSANNSSGFNYRTIANQEKLSWHSYGFAIDLNPRLNPVLEYPKLENGEEDTTAEMVVTQPKNGEYNPETPGTLTKDHPVVQFMLDRGWEWGGDWTSFKDYQHFQKPLPLPESNDAIINI